MHEKGYEGAHGLDENKLDSEQCGGTVTRDDQRDVDTCLLSWFHCLQIVSIYGNPVNWASKSAEQRDSLGIRISRFDDYSHI